MAEGFYGAKKKNLMCSLHARIPIVFVWIMRAITGITMFRKILKTTYDWNEVLPNSYNGLINPRKKTPKIIHSNGVIIRSLNNILLSK